MSTYPSLGQGASLVGPPIPFHAEVLRSYVHLPQFRPRCFARTSTYPSLGQGASLVRPPTPV